VRRVPEAILGAARRKFIERLLGGERGGERCVVVGA